MVERHAEKCGMTTKSRYSAGGNVSPEPNCAHEAGRPFDGASADEAETVVRHKGFLIVTSQRDRGLWVANILGPGGRPFLNLAGLADTKVGAVADAQATIDDLSR